MKRTQERMKHRHTHTHTQKKWKTWRTTRKKGENVQLNNKTAFHKLLFLVLEAQEYVRRASWDRCAVCNSMHSQNGDRLRYCAECGIIQYCSIVTVFFSLFASLLPKAIQYRTTLGSHIK